MPEFRVLVIDDERMLLRTLECVFKVLGCEMVGAATLKDGLQKAVEQDFDCILVDNHFPEGHSDAIIPSLVQHNPGTPLIMITGNALDEHVENALEMGVAEVLRKPFMLDQLASTLDRHNSNFPGLAREVA